MSQSSARPSSIPSWRRRWSALAALAMSATVLVAAPGAVDALDPPGLAVFISEIHYDNAGGDVGEAIEITGPAGTDLTGWSIVLYNGSNSSVYDTKLLTASIPDLDGISGVVVQDYPANGLQNGSATQDQPDGIALVNGITPVQFLSYEGIITAVDGPAIGIVSTDIGVAETGTEPVGQSLQLIDGAWTGPATSSFGKLNTAPPLPVRICQTAPDVTLISTLQGATDTSPCADEDQVLIEGVVVGNYEGASPELRGFYVQEEDADADDDPTTSEGVFVFNADADAVSIGDVVQVEGTVVEFSGQTQMSLSTITVVTQGDGITTPGVTPTEVTMPFAAADSLEAVEGMLVTFPQVLSATEYFQLGRFGQVVVSSDGKLDIPTAVAEPGVDTQAVQAANDLDRLIIDDTTNAQNPELIIYGANGQPLTAINPLRGGDTTTGATGVMTYTWAGNNASGNAYRLRPATVPIEFTTANPRPTEAPDVGGGLKVASFNVLNYFLTLDEPRGALICGPVADRNDCRGADNANEFERQRAKLLVALSKLDADVIGLVELENTELAAGGTVDVLGDLVDGLNDIEGAGTWDYVDTGLVGTDVIKVGLIYRTAVVSLTGTPAVLDSSVDARFDDTRNRPAVAASFIDNATDGIVTVVVNHFKSKGCGSATGLDADQGDGQGCWNIVRTDAAAALVDWLATMPTGVDDPDALVLGDLNSYAKEDPIDVLVDAGYVDLAAAYDTDPYSYVFDGQWGYLDYALASPTLVAQVTGAAEYHINADEVPVLDYNTDFQSAAQQADLYAPDEFRTSDHDPVLVGLDLVGPELGAVSITDVTVDESDGAVELTVTRSGADGSIGATVSYRTVDGTAIAGTDYTATSGDLTWAAGDNTDRTITVVILDDTDVEDTKTFVVELFDPVTTGIATPSATVTITDTDPIVVGPPVVTVTRERFVDTRPGGVTFDGDEQAGGALTGATTTEFQIAARGDVPTDAPAVVMYVTAVGATDTGFVTIFPCTANAPVASSLNYSAGVNIGNEIIAPLSADGTVCVSSSSDIDFTVDVVGFVASDSSTVSLAPARFLDTRAAGFTLDDEFVGSGRAAGQQRIQITGRGEVPDGAGAVIVNVAAVNPVEKGFITVHPCVENPGSSSLNFTPAITRANELIAPLDDEGGLCVFTSADTDVIADVVGYLPADSTLQTVAPQRVLDTRPESTTSIAPAQPFKVSVAGRLGAGADVAVTIAGRVGTPADADLAVLNITVVNPGARGFLSIHDCADDPTNTSALNYEVGVNGANEMFVELDASGEFCVFTSAATDLIVDIVGYTT